MIKYLNGVEECLCDTNTININESWTEKCLRGHITFTTDFDHTTIR
jgi:hypothetical protein